MKKLFFAIVVLCAVISCNNNEAYKARENTIKDSLMNQMQKRDSSIMDYVKSINTIQKSIDTLTSDAKILKTHNAEGMNDNNTLLAQIRAIDQLVIKNRKSIAELQYKLKKSNNANQDLTDLGEALSLQLNEKDSEIASIQRELVRTRASLGTLVKQFNDSMTTMNQQRAQIGIMKMEGNTVYYVIGTVADLKKRDIIVEAGGAIGLGRVPVLGQSTAGFMTGDLTQINDIPLGGRFVQFVTPHPNNSYRITSGTTDKLIITDPQDFWSRSKYMVVIIK
jgi:hypothetical protein